MAEREVWKFRIEAGGGWIETPLDAEIVDVGIQGGHVYVWAIVDPTAVFEQRQIGWFPTGVAIPDGWVYRGTAHVLFDRAALGSDFVWHVFEAAQ